MADRIASKSRAKISTFCLSSAAQSGSLGTTTPSPPTLSKPLTELLGRKGLTLLLLLATSKASPLAGATPATPTAAASTPTAAASTPTAATTAATTTTSTTPTAATTAATCPAAPTTTSSSTAAPTNASTAPTTASTFATPTAPALPAPAAAAPPTTGRRSSNLLSTKVVNSCSRGD
ncbi:unnamed protein product [Closterium sp. NIES-64]|nr:unnamed protein product [Closterium sp. NIES-64]